MDTVKVGEWYWSNDLVRVQVTGVALMENGAPWYSVADSLKVYDGSRLVKVHPFTGETA